MYLDIFNKRVVLQGIMHLNVGWLVGWLVGWMDGWMDGWMVGWLVGWLAEVHKITVSQILTLLK